MKKILFSLAILSLVAIPALAFAECPAGQHYEVTGSECSEWSTPECTHYTWKWDWSKFKLVKECDSWSESVCLNEVDTGTCVDDTEEPEDPIDEPEPEDPIDEPEVEEEVAQGGFSWINFLPRVNDRLYQNGNCLGFLTTHQSKGFILVSDNSVVFPLNTYSMCYYDPIAYPMCNEQKVGYQDIYWQEEPTVYHEICLDDLRGDYYVRPGMDDYFGGQPGYGKVLGNETLIHFE